MAVFYNSRSGYYAVAGQSLNPIAEAEFLSYEAQLHTGTGWHEYSSLQDMRNAVKANNWPAPTTSLDAAAKQGAASTAESAAKAATGSLLPALTNTRSFTGRAVKVIIGTGLILIGLAMLVKQETNISVGDVAKVAAL